MKTKFYILTSSNDSTHPRYIGKTIRDSFEKYVRCHISGSNSTKIDRLGKIVFCCNSYKSNWIRKVIQEGFDIVITYIGECDNTYGHDWQKFEQAWIAYGRAEGWELTNGTIGGDGISPGTAPWNKNKNYQK